MDEPDRSSMPSPEADDQPPSLRSSLRKASIQVEVIDQLALLGQRASASLADLASRALASLPNQGQVRVCVVDDQRMSAAHEKFSDITGTTDVLTFDLAPRTNQPDSFDTKVLDTDLTVCIDEANRQAAIHNHPVEHELLLYIIHGTLHCLGYDDHDQGQYQRMHNKEDELLTNIGIGAIFYPMNKTNKTNTDNTNPTHKEHKS